MFDGLVVVSTCRDCGLAMRVTRSGQVAHPMCANRATELEQLCQQWIEAAILEQHEVAESIGKRIDRIETVVNLPAAAKEYASWGWRVFPLARNSKMPAIPKAEGGNGFKDATDDVKRIQKWWDHHRDHNIGLATGHLFDVIDIDTKDSHGNPSQEGIRSFLKLLDGGDLPECHGIAVTSSGGLHLYVIATGKGNFAGIRPGIDYRGKGGYVVAPPSTLGQSWRSYSWIAPPSPKLKERY